MFECDHESLPLFQTANVSPTTEEANKAVEEVLASQRSASAKENKKKKCTSFTPEICAISC